MYLQHTGFLTTCDGTLHQTQVALWFVYTVFWFNAAGQIITAVLWYKQELLHAIDNAPKAWT